MQAITKNLLEENLLARKKKKKKWKQEEKAEGWACISVMKKGNSLPLYRKFLRQQTRKMKKVNKPLNGSTNRPMEKTTFTFQKCENN